VDKREKFDRDHKLFVSSSRPHVLMITNHGMHDWNVDPGLPDTGGQNVFVNHMTAAMVKVGFKVTIVNRGGYKHPLTGKDRKGYDYFNGYQRILYVEDSKKVFIRKEDMNEQIPELVEFLKNALDKDRLKIDLIVSHYWDGARLGVELNKLFPKHRKHVWIPHSLGTLKKENMDPSTWKNLRLDERIDVEKSLIPHLNGIGATSAKIREHLKKDYGYESKLFLPPCVDSNHFYPMQVTEDDKIWDFLSEHSGLAPEEIRIRKIITEISRTDDTKRKDVLLKAFAEINDKYPNTFLVISLDKKSKLYEKYMELIDSLGIRDSVAPVGSVWEQLPKIYAISYVYCTPSVMEGFGMAIQEAAASRVPAVSSDLVPFAVEYLLGKKIRKIPVEKKRFLRHGEAAVVVSADDVEGFSLALEKIVFNDALRDKMAESAYNITIPYFTWDRMLSEFLRCIGFSGPGGAFSTRYALTRDKLKDILRDRNVEKLDLAKICTHIKKEPGLRHFCPEKTYQIDPRNGDRIIYNSARARRPHYYEEPENEMETDEENLNQTPSIISEGKTTGVIDVADLSEGFTFINFNLYPMVYPFQNFKGQYGFNSSIDAEKSSYPESSPVAGLHFLQWTSSFQDVDFHNMPIKDSVIVMNRLSKLEEVLLNRKLSDTNSDKKEGYVTIIKNCGDLVGGSIAHGHQQIALSTIVPRRVRDLVNFQESYGKLFAQHMLEVTPKDLIIRDYGEAVLLVPYFMRRPYDMMLFLKNTSRRHLFELNQKEIKAVSRGWRDGIILMRTMLRALNKEIAYNIVTCNGQGSGLSFDFLPYTQEMGGFEHAGIFVCQGSVIECAKHLKAALKS